MEGPLQPELGRKLEIFSVSGKREIASGVRVPEEKCRMETDLGKKQSR